MIPKFNKSQLKLMKAHKSYTGATEDYTNNEINSKAQALMNRHPSMTRQRAYSKAKEFFNGSKSKKDHIDLTSNLESIRSLANLYRRNQGLSSRQAYRQACIQLSIG